MPRSDEFRHRAPILQITLIFAGVALAALTLFHFPPGQISFYPRCPIESLLHIQCPGCGTTRAFAALLRGHLGEALRSNALTTCALPAIVCHGIRRSVPLFQGRPLPAPVISRAMLCVSFGVLALFTLIRNL